MNTQLKTKHGILSLISGIFMLDVSDGTHINIDEAPDMLEKLDDLAIDHRLTHLWIHPSTLLNFYAIPPDVEQSFTLLPTWKYDTQIAKKMQNPLVSYYGKRLLRPYDPVRPQRKTWFKSVIFFEHCHWNWPKDATPRQLLGWIADLESRLGVPISGSPGGTGYRYLKKLYEKRPALLESPHTDLSAIPWGDSAKPLIWWRKPTEEELDENYFLFAADKNAAYPRATLEELFGYGEPTHLKNISPASVYEANSKLGKLAPGIWHISEITSIDWTAAMIDAGHLPPAIWPGAQWVSSPLLKLLVACGFTVKIDEGYFFTDHAKIFEKWVKNLWEIRQSYADGTPQKAAMKQIMNDLLGLLRSTKNQKSPIYRPDWNATVVAASRANVYYNILKYAQSGHIPVMVQMDALYYLVKFREPEAAIPGLTAQSSSLGGYKLKWVLPLNDAVKNLLLSNQAMGTKLQHLNTMAAEQESQEVAAWV